jgi:hypothetical protein
MSNKRTIRAIIIKNVKIGDEIYSEFTKQMDIEKLRDECQQYWNERDNVDVDVSLLRKL